MKYLYTLLITLLASVTLWGQTPVEFQDIKITNPQGQSLTINQLVFSNNPEGLKVDIGAVSVKDGSIARRFNLNSPFTFYLPYNELGRTRRNINPDEYAGFIATNSVLEERDGMLDAQFSINTQGFAVNKRQYQHLIFSLRSDSDTLTFAGVAAHGKIYKRLFDRRLKFQNRELLANMPDHHYRVTSLTDTLFTYSVEVEYQPWMDDAVLDVYAVLGSPAKIEQLLIFQNIGTVKLEPREPYMVQPRVNFYQPARTDKNRTMTGQAYLDFQVGKSVLLPDFRRNPEELAKIYAIVGTVLEDADITLHGINLCGYASPEGSYENNDRLSKARAEALRRHLIQKYNIAEDLFQVSNVAEDWDGLRVMVEESDIANKQGILNIIDNVGIFATPGRETQMMRLDGGRPWRTMLTEMFPDLRRVEYEAVFTVRQYSLEEAKDIVNRKPENLSPYELYILAETYPLDSPQREELFRLSLEETPVAREAIANYAGQLLHAGDLNGAKRYLDQIDEDPISFNNLGVYWLLHGDLETAEDFFIKARDNGIAEAEHNLNELQLKRENNVLMERYKNR